MGIHDSKKVIKEYGINETFYRNIVMPTIRRKYNYMCANCKSKKYLDIHHISYEKQDINHMILLCRKCHKKEHS